VSTRRYSSNTTADPVGLDASPGGWKWAQPDAKPWVRCHLVGTHGYSRVLRWYPGGWKWAQTDATPWVRCNQTRLYVAARYRNRYMYAYLANAAALQHAASLYIYLCVLHVRGRVQVIFDLQTLFRLSGVVTQARIIRRSTRARVRTLQPPPPARLPSFANAARAAGDGRCSLCQPQQGDATLGKWERPKREQRQAGTALSGNGGARLQGDATLGKWTESFAVQAASGAH
jgi:hypothetical protein